MTRKLAGYSFQALLHLVSVTLQLPLVAKILFADVDDGRLNKIKKQLNTTFYRGVMQGRWQKVKGQKGAYELG
jgi:hypothetical protein